MKPTHILSISAFILASSLGFRVVHSQVTDTPSLLDSESEKTGSKRLATRNSAAGSTEFFSPAKDPSLMHLPQKYTETTGAKKGEEFIDHFGNHHWHREPRPFPVTKSTGNYQWTSEDGRSKKAIKQLANNSVMQEQLEKENEIITQRQLIYVPDHFSQQAQDTFSGKRNELILPGPDGQEFKVKILQAGGDSTGEGKAFTGSFYGVIEGLKDSKVEAGSDDDHWSIGIETGTKSYEIVNREKGEWILTEIDPVAQARLDPGCHSNLTVDDVGEPIVE